MSEEFNKVIIGTHNTMSFLKPRHWWMRPINWLFAQCQFSDSRNDFIKCVDIRIYWDNKEGWRFAHGLVSYEFDSIYCNIFATIQKFYNSGVRYFRITLERDGNEEEFMRLCICLESEYAKSDVTFLGGHRKSDWKKLHDFGTDHIPVHQWVGSMADDARWYERFMPTLYASRMNTYNLLHAKKGINLYDFV